jgi:hypothetical protein
MDVASADRVTAALDRVAVWAPDLAPDDRYVPLSELDVPAYSQAICQRLGGAPLRVGQSALLMGIASRLWSLTVVPAARDSVLPDPATFVVREDDGAVVIGVAKPRGWSAPTATDVHDLTLDVLRPLVEALPLSERLLWGNAAASLYAVPRVHALPEAVALVGDLVERSPYAGELELLGDGRARRRTCCLFYEVPGAGLCGDCVFDHAPAASTWAPSQG